MLGCLRLLWVLLLVVNGEGTRSHLCVKMYSPCMSPIPPQALSNPKPWTHLHTSHLLWMTPPEKPKKAQRGVEGSLGSMSPLPWVPVCAITLLFTAQTPKGRKRKRERPQSCCSLCH